MCLGGWEGWLEERGKHGAARTRERCARLAARTSRSGKLGLQEVEEAGEGVEEGLLDAVEGGVAEGRPWWLFSGHHSRASVANPISWPEGGTGERCGSPPFPRA